MRQVIRVLKTPVTLIILLAMLGYGAVWGYKQVTLTSTASGATCVMQDVGKKLTSNKVSVRVLNGGEKPRGAKDTRAILIAWDYKVVFYNNSERKVDKVTVIGNSADDPEVRLVASVFEAAVTEGDGRADHTVDVIVPTVFKIVETPPTSIDVDGPVCLPPITGSASSSASPGQSQTPSATPSK